MNKYMRSVMIAASVLAFQASAAYAGFQWTAPAPSAVSPGAIQARPPEMAPRSASAPITPVQTESLGNGINAGSPIATTPDGPASAAPIYGNGMTNDPVTWNTPAQARANEVYIPRAPQATQPQSMGNMPQPIVPQQAMAAPSVMDDGMSGITYSNNPTMMAPMSTGRYDVAQGFGRDLPLVMAIRQIVPPEFGFVFDQGIDVQKHVSWQGGQPWDIVLQNTLAPMGMQASVNGNVVSIMRAGNISMQASAPMSGPIVATQTVTSSSTTTMTPAPIATPAVITAQEVMPVNMEQISAGGSNRIASQADLLARGTWTSPRHSTLRSILQDWSQRAGVELYWASEYDYPVQSAVSLNGTFEEAVQVLLRGLTDSRPRPMGRLHPNLPNGPAVLIIETRQNSM